MAEFRTTEDLSTAQQEVARQMAGGIWEILVEEGKERSMECIYLKDVIRLEVDDIKRLRQRVVANMTMENLNAMLDTLELPSEQNLLEELI